VARKLLLAAAVLLGALLLTAIATTPEALRPARSVAPISGSPADYLAAAERRVAERQPIIADTEKRIRWFDDANGRRTRYAVVYLHGFSASRQEIAPVGELIAERLGANLFETRLSGHGLAADALVKVRAEDWLADAIEALAIGSLLGERLIVIGTSTGATLALAVSDHQRFADVETLVMLSPNFAPRDRLAEILLWPGGPQLARLMLGETRSWTAANELQERYWSTSYPVPALVEMMRLVKRVRSMLPLKLDQAVLTVYSPNDQVVSIARLSEALAQIEASRSRTLELPGSGDPANHVLAGDILGAENNQTIVTEVVDFVRKAQP